MPDQRMLAIVSREYKVMLDHRLFTDRKQAVENFGHELHACTKRLKSVELKGLFERRKKREIVFLDTRDQTIALNRYVFRQRTDAETGKSEFTLKCRSPDRYVASEADLTSSRRIKACVKFEEDIGAPFVCRFSHSNTVNGPEQPPRTLKQAAMLFPVLGKLERDGQRCSDRLLLLPVNAMTAFERVFAGPMLRFPEMEAEVALILWSDGPDGRPLVTEFSFR
jgi:hypothetical protein